MMGCQLIYLTPTKTKIMILTRGTMMKSKTISRTELERVYREMKVKDACKFLGVTMYTFYKAIDDAGISRKASEYSEIVTLTVTD